MFVKGRVYDSSLQDFCPVICLSLNCDTAHPDRGLPWKKVQPVHKPPRGVLQSSEVDSSSPQFPQSANHVIHSWQFSCYKCETFSQLSAGSGQSPRVYCEAQSQSAPWQQKNPGSEQKPSLSKVNTQWPSFLTIVPFFHHQSVAFWFADESSQELLATAH